MRHRTSPDAFRVPGLLLALLALLLAADAARAHDDSAEARHRAAERGGLDGVAASLAEAEARLDGGDLAGAERILAPLRVTHARDARVAGFAARLALDAGRHAEAEALASLALAHAPDALGPLLTRARARAAMRNAVGALADLDHAIASDPGRAEEHVIERAHTAWALSGAAPALEALEAHTREGLWTPARRALALQLEQALGLAPRARSGEAAAEPPGIRARAASPLSASAITDTLLPRGASWRWYAGPAAPAGAWASASYDDGAWPTGNAPLGFGEARIVTTVPDGGDPLNRWITTYFRTTVTRAAGSAPILAAILQTDYDDGFVAYLDGIEVARRGVAAGQSWGTLAANHESGVFENVALSDASLLTPGPHVLAIELHQQAPSSSDLLWDAALLADTTRVTRTRGPYLQNATPTAMTVRWRTATAVVGRVSLGPAGGPYTLTYDEAAAGTEHEVRLTSLSPETAYAYSVHGTLEPAEPVSAARTFRTPPEAGADRPVRIWTIGDSGYNTLGGQQVRDAYLAWSAGHQEDLWLLLGDNAYVAGTDAEYQTGLFDQYPLPLSRSPVWSTRGNHDQLYTGANNDYYDIFTLPMAAEAGGVPSATEAWYSFDWGPVHFVCLDSEGSLRTLASPMLQWLRADLAATTQPWVISFWHHPPYTKGSHDSDNIADSGGRMRDMRENVLPILDSLGVDLVLSGHSHAYERSFLLNGHYGTSGTLTSAMKVDGGDGRESGGGAYVKSAGGPVANEGTVYTVNGSACQISGGSLNHPAMVTSLNVLGSMVIDIAGERLDARFLDNTGALRDSFTILKPMLVGVPRTGGTSGLALAAPSPSPFHEQAAIEFTLPRAAAATLSVYDVSGRLVHTLARGPHRAGTHRAVWDGRDGAGREVPAGAYMIVLDSGGERRARRAVCLP